MEIFDQHTNMLQANISSKYPVFTVGGLDSEKRLKIIIYAINVKGRSDSVLLEASTLKAAEKQMGKLNFFPIFQLSLGPPRNEMNECIFLITSPWDTRGWSNISVGKTLYCFSVAVV